MKIKAETLAFWYFRLNGFLTIQDFVVHPENRRDYGTDIDILGVRFPYRAELFSRPMKDDDVFTRIADRPYFIIAEVKKTLCDLNGPWTKPEKRNMYKLLRAIGAFRQRTMNKVAESLYDNGYCSNTRYHISLFCVGNTRNPKLQHRYPEVPQIIWPEVLRFIFTRLGDYRYEKSWHDRWDDNGQNLWDCMEASHDISTFLGAVDIVS
jgi:hypothetical protein